MGMKATAKDVLEKIFVENESLIGVLWNNAKYAFQNLNDDVLRAANEGSVLSEEDEPKPSKNLRENLRYLEKEIAQAIADDWNSQIDDLANR